MSIGPTVHRYKTAPTVFAEIWSGEKRHEVRVNDRPTLPKRDDLVVLQEWDQVNGYRRALVGRVTYTSVPGTWGLPTQLVVFSFRVLVWCIEPIGIPQQTYRS